MTRHGKGDNPITLPPHAAADREKLLLEARVKTTMPRSSVTFAEIRTQTGERRKTTAPTPQRRAETTVLTRQT
jgi:hypothetical protein